MDYLKDDMKFLNKFEKKHPDLMSSIKNLDMHEVQKSINRYRNKKKFQDKEINSESSDEKYHDTKIKMILEQFHNNKVKRKNFEGKIMKEE